MSHGLILTAPASGSGKTTLTLAILRALHRRGSAVRGGKSGPDYIDPRFHEAACGQLCLNLDAWAMPPERLRSLAAGPGLLVIEGAMGLFDGAPPDGKGATADLARHLGLPCILIVDAGRMAQSITPIVEGFMRHSSSVNVTGMILNKVGSARHETMLRRALAPLGVPVLGALHRNTDLTHPGRHLGLVQAQERPDLEVFLNRAADLVETTLDLDALCALAAPLPKAAASQPMPPPAQRIAIAQDRAFAFTYPHLLADWRAMGAELKFFSPLADEAPPEADLIYLPGGYPELYAGQIAGNSCFLSGMKKRSEDTDIYGECGGYMTLGDGLIDAQGHRHAMLGLLRLETSFKTRKLHLGYRHLQSPHGPFKGRFAGHEFHYATTLRAEGTPLFTAQDAEATALPAMGLVEGRTSGSFAHIIAPALPLPAEPSSGCK